MTHLSGAFHLGEIRQRLISRRNCCGEASQNSGKQASCRTDASGSTGAHQPSRRGGYERKRVDASDELFDEEAVG